MKDKPNKKRIKNLLENKIKKIRSDINNLDRDSIEARYLQGEIYGLCYVLGILENE